MLVHLLARYVVNTDPVSIIKELLPVAVPVYRLEPEALDRERALALAEAEPSAQTRTAGEVQEARRQALAAERRRMRHAGADACASRRAACRMASRPKRPGAGEF